jgi:hypothetical protein
LRRFYCFKSGRMVDAAAHRAGRGPNAASSVN